MALLTPLSFEQAQRVVGEYGLGVAEFCALSEGSVNSNFRVQSSGGESLFLRVYEEQAPSEAAHELQLLTELARAGLPVVEALTRSDGGRLCSHAQKPVALFPWRAGEVICSRRVTAKMLHRLGQSLAGIHIAPVGHLPAGRFGARQLWKRLARVREASVISAERLAWLEEALKKSEARSVQELGRGLIHGDLFRDNVLWQGEELSALLDFESASEGIFVYDLMVVALAWCFTDIFEPPRLRSLLSGYESVRPLSSSEWDAAAEEARAVCLRFCITRLTDFEMRSEPDGVATRDYRRFLERYQQIGDDFGEILRKLVKS